MHLARKLALIIALVLASVGLVPLTATPATAHAGYTWCESTNDPGEIGGHGCWQDSGDGWFVCDEDSGDGYFAWGQFRIQQPNGTWQLMGSQDDGQDAGCEEGLQVNVPDGTHFRIRICLKQSATASPVYCDMRESSE